jgi:hypothetical protein
MENDYMYLPNKILGKEGERPWLYLGSKESRDDEEVRRTLKIQHVVDLSGLELKQVEGTC